MNARPRLVDSDAHLHLLETLGELALANQIRPEGPMGNHEEGRVLSPLGQGEELSGQGNGL